MNTTNVLDKCLHKSTTSGSSRQNVVEIFKKLNTLGFASYDGNHGTCGKSLHNRVKDLVGANGATEQEIDAIHSHILASLPDVALGPCSPNHRRDAFFMFRTKAGGEPQLGQMYMSLKNKFYAHSSVQIPRIAENCKGIYEVSASKD